METGFGNLATEQYGNWASCLGLAITLLVWIRVGAIHQYYAFRARVPELVSVLDEQASGIADCLNDFTALSSRATKNLHEIAATLKSLEAKLPPNSRGPVRNLLRSVRAYDPVTKGETGLRKIYNELSGITVAVHLRIKDLESL